MNEQTRAFVDACLVWCCESWTIEAKARELAQMVLESYDKAGIPNLLPTLAIDGLPGVTQEDFDREVEGAFNWLYGEMLNYLKGV